MTYVLMRIIYDQKCAVSSTLKYKTFITEVGYKIHDNSDVWLTYRKETNDILYLKIESKVGCDIALQSV